MGNKSNNKNKPQLGEVKPVVETQKVDKTEGEKSTSEIFETNTPTTFKQTVKPKQASMKADWGK